MIIVPYELSDFYLSTFSNFTAFVNIYLIDSVTGGVVFHTAHKQATGPVHLVHSENWIVVRKFKKICHPTINYYDFVSVPVPQYQAEEA